MNTYVCFCTKSTGPVEINAETILAARDAAREKFAKMAPRKKIKSTDITPVLAAINHAPVMHWPLS